MLQRANNIFTKKIKMGQKINANFFRLGVQKKNWELKYFEKNQEESSFYLYKNLEIQKYLKRFFQLHKIKVHNCKVCYTTYSLEIVISFYITEKTISIIDKVNTLKKLSDYKQDFSTLYKRLEIRKKVRKNILNAQLSTKQVIVLHQFQEILLESLSIYTKKNCTINIIFQNLNKNKQLSQSHKKDLKTIFKQLRKFNKNSFFKEAVNIFFICAWKRKSAKLLAEFISDQFKLNQLKTDQASISRKDNYFLGFLKQSLDLILKSSKSSITGIKIAIKGRFNKAPRAKKVIMHFGKFSLPSFNSKIDYFQSTGYTSNGTFGIKVWICEN